MDNERAQERGVATSSAAQYKGTAKLRTWCPTSRSLAGQNGGGHFHVKHIFQLPEYQLIEWV